MQDFPLTPNEAAALDLFELAGRICGLTLVHDQRPQFDEISDAAAMGGSGVEALCSLATELWQLTGSVGRAIRHLDAEHRAFVADVVFTAMRPVRIAPSGSPDGLVFGGATFDHGRLS